MTYSDQITYPLHSSAADRVTALGDYSAPRPGGGCGSARFLVRSPVREPGSHQLDADSGGWTAAYPLDALTHGDAVTVARGLLADPDFVRAMVRATV